MADLGKLLKPDSIAIVGATADFDIIRGRVVRTVLHHRYRGDIYLVSRSEREIAGRRTYASISELPAAVDLMLLLVPAAAVCGALREAGERGIGAAIVFASGFAEEGDAGAELQREIAEIARHYGMAVSGPNGEGFADFATGLAATFSPVMDGLVPPSPHDLPERGRISIIAQSGAMGFAFADFCLARQAPLGQVVTTGNEATIDLSTYLEHAIDAGEAHVFVLFIETLRRPDVFLRAAGKALQQGKPIIAVKIGRSAASRRATLSHTGALAGADEGYRAVFRKLAVVEAFGIEEAVDLAVTFSRHLDRLPAGRNVGIFTASGGGGGLAADVCADHGLIVPELDTDTRRTIDGMLPSYGSSSNPVDGTAQAVRFAGYAQFAELLIASDTIDSALVIASGRTAVTLAKEADALQKLAKTANKPVLFWSYTLPAVETTGIIARAGLPLMTSLPNAARSMAEMARYAKRRQARLIGGPKQPVAGIAPEAASTCARMLAEAGRVVCEHEVRPLLGLYGVQVGETVLVKDADAAADAVTALGGPVAMKVQSPDIAHKSESGGVRLDVSSGPDAEAAFAAIVANARAHAPGCELHGVLVQKMAQAGREIVLGVSRDETFGHVMMIGWGGVYVEALNDTAFAVLPVAETEARACLQSLQVWPILEGVRGEAPSDIEALIDLILRVSRFVGDHASTIDELDLNPVLVHRDGKGVTVADALLVKAGP